MAYLFPAAAMAASVPLILGQHAITAGIRHTRCVSSYGYLRVGSLVLSHLRNGVGDELMALFRDDMLSVTPSTASQYYTPERGYTEQDPGSDYEMNLFEFRSPGPVIAARLDVMGVDAAGAFAYLEEQLGAGEHRFTSMEVVYGVTGTDVTRLPEYGVSP